MRQYSYDEKMRQTLKKNYKIKKKMERCANYIPFERCAKKYKTKYFLLTSDL